MSLSGSPSTGHLAPPQVLANLIPGRLSSSSMHDDEIRRHPVTNDGLDDDVDTVSGNDMILALDGTPITGNKFMIGASYYNGNTGMVYIMEEILTDNILTIEQLLIQAQPKNVILSSRAPSEFIEIIEKYTQQATFMDEEADVCLITFKPSTDFSYESSIETLNKMISSCNNRNASSDTAMEKPHDSQHLRLSSYIDLKNRISISCAGIILTAIQKIRSGAGDISPLCPILRTFTLEGILFINTDTIQSLQIFRREKHSDTSHIYKSQEQVDTKKAASIYDLVRNLAVTNQGKINLKEMFLRPVTELEVLTPRQQLITTLLASSNTKLLKGITVLLRSIKDMNRVMGVLERGVGLSGSQKEIGHIWRSLFVTINAAMKLPIILQQLCSQSSNSILSRVTSSINMERLSEVERRITKTLDFETGISSSKAVTIKQGLHPDFDRVKIFVENIELFLAETCDRIKAELPLGLRELVKGCAYVPQLGFFTKVDINTSVLQNDRRDWKQAFQTEETSYYKNNLMLLLDEKYGDVRTLLHDLEIEIIYNLSYFVLGYKETIVSMSSACGELDAYCALAKCAQKYDWVMPHISDSTVLNIKKGRHPIQELLTTPFIPNDCFISGALEEHSTNEQGLGESGAISMMLTGPNHSGKSVYLKQVALIVYLAHIGSYVPASEAHIGLTDKILTRISTRESATLTESAFSIDLHQTSQAIAMATRRSLVIVDEFGKGTRPDDGAGLFAGLVHYFFSLNNRCPRLLLATHFHEIIGDITLDTGNFVQLWHMRVNIEPQSKNIEEQVTYNHILAPGNNPSSFGCQCAALNGIELSVLEKAEYFIQLLKEEGGLEYISSWTDTEMMQLHSIETVLNRFACIDLENLSRSEIEAKLFLDDLLQQK